MSKNIKINLKYFKRSFYIDDKVAQLHVGRYDIFGENKSSNSYSSICNIKSSDLPHLFDKSISLYDEDDIMKVVSTNHYIDKLEDGEYYYIIDIDNEKENTFNKKTLEYTEEFPLDKNIFNNISDQFIAKDNIYIFYTTVLKYKSPFLYESLEDAYIKNKSANKYESYRNSLFGTTNSIINLYNMAVVSSLGFEKVIRINPDLIYSNFKKEVIELNNDGKINKVLEVPKFVLNYINKNGYHDLLLSLQDINIDGSEFRILIDFFENSSTIVPSNKRANIFGLFANVLADIYKYQEYRMKHLLSFLIRESYFNKYKYGSELSAEHDMVFNFPIEEAILLRDYLRMCHDNNLEHEKYPNTVVDHDIATKNIDIRSRISELEFSDAVEKYSDMTNDFSSKEYVVKAPSSLLDLIQEGNNLRHCVASYAYDILKGKSKIFFLRKADEPNTPYITIEVNELNELNHIRGEHNTIPDSTIISIVKRWLNKVQ